MLTVSRGAKSSAFFAEELRADSLDSGYNQSPVQKFVAPLARGFRDQQASVTRRPVQETLLALILGSMLRADRINYWSVIGSESRPRKKNEPL